MNDTQLVTLDQVRQFLEGTGKHNKLWVDIVSAG